MEHPILFLVKLFEALGLGAFAHHYPHVLYTWLVVALLWIFGRIGAKALTLVPGSTQNFLEILVETIENFVVDVAGEEGRRFFPILATVFLFILASNLLGLLPGFYPPTASINTTVACALIVVISTHVIGVMYHGAKYYKHFIGPVWWMMPLIIPIEIIGHAARVLSLSFRLFGNIAGHEMVLALLFMLAGAMLAPVPIMGLGIFVALVQSFVFFLLSTMYFAGAMEEAH